MDVIGWIIVALVLLAIIALAVVVMRRGRRSGGVIAGAPRATKQKHSGGT